MSIHCTCCSNKLDFHNKAARTPAIMALLQHAGSETEEELNENRFPCLLCVASDYLPGQYEQQLCISMQRKMLQKCSVGGIQQ